MNLIRPLFSLLILIFLTTDVIAQDVKQYIPKDAFMLFEVNTKRINSKYDMDKIRQFDFMKMLEQEMENAGSDMNDLYQDPKAAGLKENGNYYLFGTTKGDVTSIQMLLEIEDAAKYKAMMTKETDSEVNSSKDNSFEFINKEGAIVGWNSKCAVINIPLPNTDEDKTGIPEWDDMSIDEDEAKEEIEEMEIEPETAINISPKSMEQSLMQLNNIFKNTKVNSILADPTYLKTMTQNHDINMYINYDNGMPSSTSSKLSEIPMPPAMKEIMDHMYDGYTIDGGFDFNDGAVDVTMNTNMGGDMAKIFKASTSNTLNKNFAKYIKKENLLGYFSLAYNIDNSITAMKDVFSPMKEDIDEAEKGMDGMLQSFGMGMTTNDVYKLLKGDMVIAMTGMRDFEKEVTTFEYDDDFNRTEVTKNVKESLPEFVMLLSSENQENVQKLFDMGKNFSVLAEGEKYYTAAVPGSPMDVKMTMQNGIIIISNDDNLMNGNLKKGLKRKKRISKNHQKDLLLNSQTLFWDLGSTISMAKAMLPSDATSDKMMKSLEESLDNISLNTTKMVGNKMVSKGQISFKNKKMNSIEQFFNIINEMSLIGEAGMRM